MCSHTQPQLVSARSDTRSQTAARLDPRGLTDSHLLRLLAPDSNTALKTQGVRTVGAPSAEHSMLLRNAQVGAPSAEHSMLLRSMLSVGPSLPLYTVTNASYMARCSALREMMAELFAQLHARHWDALTNAVQANRRLTGAQLVNAMKEQHAECAPVMSQLYAVVCRLRTLDEALAHCAEPIEYKDISYYEVHSKCSSSHVPPPLEPPVAELAYAGELLARTYMATLAPHKR